MKDKNYYDILGISSGATDAEIKSSYRKLVQKFHPDKNSGDKFFEEYFKNVLEAYKVLSDPILKYKYDSLRDTRYDNSQEENKNKTPAYKINTFVDDNNIQVGSLIKLTITIDADAVGILAPTIPGLRRIKDPYLIPKNNYQETESELTKFGCYFVADKSGNIIIPAFNIMLSNNETIKTPIKRLQVEERDNIPTNNNIDKSISTPNSDTGKVLFFLMFAVALLIFFAIMSKNESNTKIRNNKIANKSEINEIIREHERSKLKSNIDADKYAAELLKTATTSKYLGNQLNTGDSPYDHYFGEGIYKNKSYNFIEFKNGMTNDAIVCLVNVSTERVIRNEYIRKGDSFKMTNISDGQYYMKSFFGKNWNPEKKLLNGKITGAFDTGLRFSKSDKPSDIFELKQTQSSKGIKYSTFQVTLYPVENGNMESQNIDASEFFE